MRTRETSFLYTHVGNEKFNQVNLTLFKSSYQYDKSLMTVEPCFYGESLEVLHTKSTLAIVGHWGVIQTESKEWEKRISRRLYKYWRIIMMSFLSHACMSFELQLHDNFSLFDELWQRNDIGFIFVLLFIKNHWIVKASYPSIYFLSPKNEFIFQVIRSSEARNRAWVILNLLLKYDASTIHISTNSMWLFSSSSSVDVPLWRSRLLHYVDNDQWCEVQSNYWGVQGLFAASCFTFSQLSHLSSKTHHSLIRSTRALKLDSSRFIELDKVFSLYINAIN